MLPPAALARCSSSSAPALRIAAATAVARFLSAAASADFCSAKRLTNDLAKGLSLDLALMFLGGRGTGRMVGRSKQNILSTRREPPVCPRHHTTCCVAAGRYFGMA